MRHHISKSGKVVVCKAENTCPLGTSVGGEASKLDLKDYIEIKSDEDGRFEYNKENNLQYTLDEASKRGEYVDKTVTMYIESQMITSKIHRDPITGEFTKERQKLHREILDELHKKYESVPTDGKVIFSAGLPGSGKTTVLQMLKEENSAYDMKNYVVVSSDDMKEEFAKREMIPKIEGLSQMEASTLAHEESSYLADRFLEETSTQNKNVIYDFTCKNFDATSKRMSTLIDSGYEVKNMQFVFVDIPLETAQERALIRYRKGLNDSISSDEHAIGGRYLPPYVLETNRSRTGVYSSKNAEALLAVKSVYNSSGLPDPIVYDNSGNSFENPEYKPTKVDFEEFQNRSQVKQRILS